MSAQIYFSILLVWVLIGHYLLQRSMDAKAKRMMLELQIMNRELKAIERRLDAMSAVVYRRVRDNR